ncbi:unnamed protein product [Linum trigynum]|uniref:Uncharacterized protein n=1 Tax=Linum trigynum TaxID=586398 RepID=A0AAV2GKJ0_9ROSI
MVVELEQANLTSYTRCLVAEKVCSVVFNSKSRSNLISTRAVSKLGLPTHKHPAPYLLPLLEEEGSAFVTEQVLLQFKIGSYIDEVLCEIVPLKLTHVVLGKPWHYDRNAQCSRRTNHIRLRHCAKLFALKLLSPEEAAEDRSTLLQKLRDEEEQAKEVEDSAWEKPLKEPEFQRVEENQLVGAEELCFLSTKQGMREREVGGDLGTESIEADTANTLVESPVTNTLREIASKQAESPHPIQSRTPLETAELDMKMLE